MLEIHTVGSVRPCSNVWTESEALYFPSMVEKSIPKFELLNLQKLLMQALFQGWLMILTTHAASRHSILARTVPISDRL